MTPVGVLGIMGGRIGNVMNGTDTGGRLTNLGIGFHWPEPGTPTFGALGRVVFGDQLWRFSPPACAAVPAGEPCVVRSEEHTSELQSRENLVCRLLLEKKN